MTATDPPTTTADQPLVTLCRDLLRIDTTNYGDDQGPGERVAAEYVAAHLSGSGLTPEIIEPRPGRSSVLARWEGSDPGRPALVVHAHLDVVPADASAWSHHPLSGEIADGCLWGRGAVDMKYFVGQVLDVVREWSRAGRRPGRDIVLAFVADEEAGGHQGARWLAANRPELFDGATEAIGEVGGYSATLPTGRRLYLVETGEKGISWYRLTARGTAGHGSMINDDNCVVGLAAIVGSIGAHEFPVRLTPTTRDLLERVAAEVGEPFHPDTDPTPLLRHLGPIARMVASSLRHVATPTRLSASAKTNVVPGQASVEVDCRFLPGREGEFVAELLRLAGPRAEHERVYHDEPVESAFPTSMTDAMAAAVAAADPDGVVVPYLLPAATDAKHLRPLGISCYGFAPLRLPPEFDFPAAFHGVDERVPVEALLEGRRILEHFLERC